MGTVVPLDMAMLGMLRVSYDENVFIWERVLKRSPYLECVSVRWSVFFCFDSVCVSAGVGGGGCLRSMYVIFFLKVYILWACITFIVC